MGKEEILNYVMNSPGNTNRAVLSGMLGDTDGSEGEILIIQTLNYSTGISGFCLEDVNSVIDQTPSIIKIVGSNDGEIETINIFHLINVIHADTETDDEIPFQAVSVIYRSANFNLYDKTCADIYFVANDDTLPTSEHAIVWYGSDLTKEESEYDTLRNGYLGHHPVS